MYPSNVMQDYRNKERMVFSQIPGMEELLRADQDTVVDIQIRYPDAAFVLQIAGELFNHDREISMINQRSYFSILNGESISSVRFRHDKDVEQYVIRHMWDD